MHKAGQPLGKAGVRIVSTVAALILFSKARNGKAALGGNVIMRRSAGRILR